MKKVLVILLSAALLLTVLSACSKKQESAAAVAVDLPQVELPQKVTLGTQLGITQEAIAIAEGWLPEVLGVEVDIVNFDSGRDVNTAMASGAIDFGLVGSVPASLAIANGIPCQVVYIQGILGETDALIVQASLGVKNAQGLAGRKIATAFSSINHYSLIKYLEINNVNPSDVDIIDMNTGDIAAAFVRGDIDGAYTWEPHVTNMKNNGGVMLTNSREVADRGYPTMDLTVVRTGFAEKYPGLVSAYIRTMDRAVALYRSDPQAAGAALAGYTELTSEECLVQLAGNIWLTVSEQKSMRWAGTSALGNSLYDTAMFLYERGDIAQEPTAELFQQAITNRYLDEWTGK